MENILRIRSENGEILITQKVTAGRRMTYFQANHENDIEEDHEIIIAEVLGSDSAHTLGRLYVFVSSDIITTSCSN